MRACEFSVLLFRYIERLFERGELAAQRRDLLIEDFHLRQRAGGEPLLQVELAAQRSDFALCIGRSAADAFVKTPIAVALAFGCGQAGAQRGELLLEAQLAGLLQ